MTKQSRKALTRKLTLRKLTDEFCHVQLPVTDIHSELTCPPHFLPMPKVIVPEAPRKSFKLKQQHELNKTAQYLKIPLRYLVILILSGYAKNLADTVPKTAHLYCACSIKTFLLHARDIAHGNRSFHPTCELSLRAETLSRSLHTIIHKRTGAQGTSRNKE